MKKTNLIALLLFAVVSTSFAQDRGIGLRFGIPTGITYKKYLQKGTKAFELGLGTLTGQWYPHYYENTFNDFDRFEGKNYVSHHVNSVVYLQARYLKQNEIYIEGMMGNLDWYWGIGALAKFGSVEYRYRNEAGFVERDVLTDIDFGPEGILGMEYTFEDVPITIFGEFSLMIEIADRPGVFRGLSGAGVRYNF